MNILSSVFSSHSHTLKTFILTLSIFASAPAYALELRDIPKIMLATGAVYATSQLYVTYQFNSATDRYESARVILATHANNQDLCLKKLKQDVLRKHDRMIQSYWLSMPSNRSFPLMWYIEKLDATIRSLTIARWFTWYDTTITDLDVLLDDLYAIRDYIVTDYDYVLEKRQFKKNR